MDKIPLRVFLFGMIWTAMGGLSPAGSLFLLQLSRHHMDWPALGWTALPGAVLGGVAFYKKYQAYLQLPPDLELARQLSHQVKTTESTIELQSNPPAIKTTTVETTEIKETP